jgi:hypothetical protein
MRRTLVTLLITSAAASCGGPAKPTTPPPQLPEDKKPEVVAAPAPVKPAPPPKDPDPIDVPLEMGKATYKLRSPGKGTKSVIKIAATAGMTQPIELALDFAGKQVAPADLGGTQEDVAPTLVLASDVVVGDVTPDGSKFTVTVTGVDARDRTGAKATKDQFKSELGILKGIQLAGTVAASGQISGMSLHVAKPTANTMAALELVKISMMPMWPLVPTEAIGVGAKWTVTTPYTIANQIQATQTTDYEVVSHKGTAWVVKGKTKLTGDDQVVKENKFEKIGGTGGVDVTITDGVFMPTSATKLTDDFSASVAAGQDPKDKDKKTVVQFHLEQGLAVGAPGMTPVAMPAATTAADPKATKVPATPASEHTQPTKPNAAPDSGAVPKKN